MPLDWDFLINGSTGLNLDDSGLKTMLLVKTNPTSSSWIGLKSVSYGTATIYKNGVATQTTLANGDATNNYFIYENGYEVKEGDTIKVVVTSEITGLSGTYDFTRYAVDQPWFLGKRIYLTNVPNDWDVAYAYAWTGSGNSAVSNAPWPGVEMTATGDDYYFDLPKDYEKILFTNGDGSQTVDITLNYNHKTYTIGALSDGKYACSGATPENGEEFEMAALEDLRFNFYITSAKQISIAAVPFGGNGFYIMPSVDGNNSGYENYTKMITYGDNNGARYGRFYFAGGKSYYIRSYVSAVDTLHKTFGNLATGITGNTTTGLITIAADKGGYYSVVIEVPPYGSVPAISISQASASNDSFKLNPIAIDGGSSVQFQKTALVLEIEFTLVNSHSMTISATAEGFTSAESTMKTFAGAVLWVSTARIDEPYDTMVNTTGIYTTLNNSLGASNVLSDQLEETIAAGDENRSLYAYILVDYKDAVTAGTVSVNVANDFLFTLIATQA